jgi:hypothetical protein
MQPTKYPSETPVIAAGGLAGGLLSSMDHGGDSWPLGAALAGPGGREAPLDLIEEHLTSVNDETQYRRGMHGGVLLKNWFFPESWTGLSEGKPDRFVLKIQPFAKGGYEASVRLLDLEKIGNAIVNGGRRGKREVPDVMSVENQQKAASRAKRNMRLKVKNMMADHLVTFTKREAEGQVYWVPEQWAQAWDKFRRLMVRVIGDFPYVAILEKHEKGNYHLHVAWCGRVNVGLCRKMWLAALGGGKGCGNIDARHIKVKSGGDRAARIARYISKYVSKHFENDSRYNKKRYWASRQTLEEARRYVLSADTVDKALFQMVEMLGIDLAKFVKLHAQRACLEDIFFFPDGSGLWLNYVPDVHGSDPPF